MDSARVNLFGGFVNLKTVGMVARTVLKQTRVEVQVMTTQRVETSLAIHLISLKIISIMVWARVDSKA